MKKMVFVAMVVVSMALTAEAARKGSGKQQPNNPRQPSEPCVAYGCNDSGYDEDRNDDQSSNDTYVPGSGTYEGNDRDTGSEYINGMPY